MEEPPPAKTYPDGRSNTPTEVDSVEFHDEVMEDIVSQVIDELPADPIITENGVANAAKVSVA